jgi:signal transduction histidine kinase
VATENFLTLLLPEDRPKLLAVRDQIAAGISPAPFEYRIRRPDGEVRHIYRETELIRDETGKPVRMIATFQDVTEARIGEVRQRELEKQLRHSQKLEALGTLAGGIAHDLNNTLVPVLALSQMLSVPEEDRDDLRTIILAARRAKELVQQILAFSRKQDMQKGEVSPAVVVEEALQMLRSTLPPNVAIIEQIGVVPAIHADGGQLQQVIVNLVTNASHAIGETQGSVTVAVSTLDAADGSGTFIQISITDTGCGMEQAVVDRIFEPFFTTKGVGEGTGLGLAVVHGIITGHHGTIEVKSKPGVGTTFTILLPILEPAEVALEAA